MACQCGVVHFDVHFEVFVQTVGFQEADNRFRVCVILMLGRFHRFRLNQERTFEAACTGIVACNGQHLCKVFFFTLLVGIQQRHIAFASTPEHVVRTAQFDCCVNGILDLNGSAGHNVKVGIGGGTVHVTCMTEYVGSTPQQFDTCFLLLLLGVCNDGFQVCFVLFDCIGLVAKVNIVEAVIFDAHFLHELETSIHFILGSLQFIGITVPGEVFRSAAELVATLCTECMPPCHRELQPIFHLLAHDYFFRIVVAECHRILTFFAFEFDFSYSGKILFCCHND